MSELKKFNFVGSQPPSPEDYRGAAKVLGYWNRDPHYSGLDVASLAAEAAIKLSELDQPKGLTRLWLFRGKRPPNRKLAYTDDGWSPYSFLSWRAGLIPLLPNETYITSKTRAYECTFQDRAMGPYYPTIKEKPSVLQGETGLSLAVYHQKGSGKDRRIVTIAVWSKLRHSSLPGNGFILDSTSKLLDELVLGEDNLDGDFRQVLSLSHRDETDIIDLEIRLTPFSDTLRLTHVERTSKDLSVKAALPAY